MRIRIYSYNNGDGSKNLSDLTGWPRLRHEGSTFRPRRDDVVVNWGSSSHPDFGCRVLNEKSKLSVTNKLSFFQAMPSEIVPEWTDDYGIASGWLKEGHTLVLRHKLTGHSGEGIELVYSGSLDDDDSMGSAPLYVKYQKKTHEYRAHVVQGNVIDVQQKKRKLDVPDDEVDWKIRNLRGGFIYAREGVVPPEPVLDVARRAFEASGLDFGAFDVIHHEPSGKSLVLEVNTAPGITGTTVQRYADALTENILAGAVELS